MNAGTAGSRPPDARGASLPVPDAGFGRDLARRVATAAVALPLLLAAVFLGPPTLVVGLAFAAAAIGMLEFHGLMRAAGLRPLPAPFGLLALAACFADALGYGPVRPLWPIAVALIVLPTLGRAPAAGGPVAAATLLGAGYLGAGGGLLAALRELPPVELGAWRVGLLLAIVMGSDTLAYFAGQALGRHRLAPRLSPGKTVEGALAGLLGGVAGALVLKRLGLPALPALHAVVLGLAAAGLGMAGDLFESLLKRWAGVKDSGRLFPGHGGMLDRVDGLLFAAPVLYYYFVASR